MSQPAAAPEYADAGLVAGELRGYRWWSLPAPRLDLSPFSADAAAWEPGLLRGMRDVWQPGVNIAECKGGFMPHPDENIPAESCHCGYWAYWQPQPHDLPLRNAIPVIGVIRGYGNTLAGDRMFRASRAQIVALHLPFSVSPAPPEQPEPARPWYEHPKFTGRVINIGTADVPQPLRERPRPPAPAEQEIAEARDRGEAWMAVISDYLERAYPGAEVCATLGLMTAKYPPDPQCELPETRCEHCGQWFEDIHSHYGSCYRAKLSF